GREEAGERRGQRGQEGGPRRGQGGARASRRRPRRPVSVARPFARQERRAEVRLSRLATRRTPGLQDQQMPTSTRPFRAAMAVLAWLAAGMLTVNAVGVGQASAEPAGNAA